MATITKTQTLSPAYPLKDFGHTNMVTNWDVIPNPPLQTAWIRDYSDISGYYAWGKSQAARNVGKPNNGTQIFTSTQEKPPIFNTCSNYRSQGFALPVAKQTWNYTTPGGPGTIFMEPYWVHPWYSSYTTTSIPDDIVVNPASVIAARQRAVYVMEPRFEAEFSALNFLYELKDFRHIAKSLAKRDYSARLLTWAKRTKRIIRDAYKEAGKSNVSSNVYDVISAATGSLAKAWLIKAFAIDPTVSDCITLHQLLQESISKAQVEFNVAGQEENTAYYTETLYENNVGSYGSKSLACIYTGKRDRVTFNATHKYTYTYAMRSEIQAIARYFRLAPSLESVWDMIPFSFLLDYFIKIGDVLNMLRRDENVNVFTNQYCESILKTCENGIYLYADSPLVHAYVIGSYILNPYDKDAIPLHPPGRHCLMTGWRRSQYNRLPMTYPRRVPWLLPRLNVPNLSQQLNMAALVRVFWGSTR